MICVCFVEHLDPNPILFRTSFQKTKNLEKTFTLISGCWETLKHANLIDFRGNCQVFIKESICKTLFLNFLKKVRIFMYLCFLQNLTNSTKKFIFSQIWTKSDHFDENRKRTVFPFLEIKQINRIRTFRFVANWSSFVSNPLACATLT